MNKLKKKINITKMTAEIKDGMLIVSIPINDPPTPSASGKTLIVASTKGNMPSTVHVNGNPVVIGLNAYIRR